MFAHSRLALRVVVTCALVAFACPVAAQIGCAETWTPGLSPLRDPNAAVDCVATVDLGNGPELIVTGRNITQVADVFVSRTARLVGSTWVPLGPPAPGTPDLYEGRSFAAFDDGSGGGTKLYVAGIFLIPGNPTPVGHVGRWDGTGWTLLGGAPTPGAVKALEVFDFGSGPVLVAAGQFLSIGGAFASHFASWDGTGWTAVGNMPVLAVIDVTCLEVYDAGTGPQLFAGVAPSPAFAPPGSGLQRFNGTNWVSAGGAGPNYVTALATHADWQLGSVLVVAGLFVAGQLATIPASVGFFDGLTYSYGGQAITSSNTAIETIASFDDGTGPAIYYGGNLTAMTLSPTNMPGSAVAAQRVIRYQNGVLTPLGAGLPGSFEPIVKDLVVFPLQGVPTLVAGGNFIAESAYLARFDGSSWTGLTPGFPFPGEIRAAVAFDDGSGLKLYVGGSFQGIGSSAASNFARWNGSSWEGLVAPLNVHAMVVHDDGTGPALYLAGEPTFVAPQFGMIVAKWNGGSSFTPLGAGLTGTARAMTVWDDGTGPALWVGGVSFNSKAFFVRVTATGWQTLTQIAGLPGPESGSAGSQVLTLAVGLGRSLVIGGQFQRFGGLTVSNVALLRPGYGVDTLGSGFPNVSPVTSVAVHDDGGGPTLWAVVQSGFGAIHRFDPATSTWSLVHPLQPGVGSFFVRALPHGNATALYTCNYLTAVGRVIERFDGTTWNPVSAVGFDNRVNDVIPYDDGIGWGLWAVGRFKTVGTIPSGGVARVGMVTPTVLAAPVSQSVALGQPVTLSVVAGGAAPLAYLWSHDGVPGSNAPAVSIASATFADAGTYDVQVSNACGFASRSATIAVRGCDLAINQPGPGSLAVTLSGGPPSAHAFTALSLLTTNATQTGNGPFLGLYIGASDLIAQFVSQIPPFVTSLSALGSSTWSSGPLPPQLIGLTIWGVATLYDPSTGMLTGAPSFIAQQLIL